MKLEEQVTSLALSKRLKELDIPQESLFYWVISLTTPYHLSYTENQKDLLPQERNDYYSAFTVAELGELTKGVTESYFSTTFSRWGCGMRSGDHNPTFYADTEVDARAKMLIYLVEREML